MTAIFNPQTNAVSGVLGDYPVGGLALVDPQPQQGQSLHVAAMIEPPSGDSIDPPNPELYKLTLDFSANAPPPCPDRRRAEPSPPSSAERDPSHR